MGKLSWIIWVGQCTHRSPCKWKMEAEEGMLRGGKHDNFLVRHGWLLRRRKGVVRKCLSETLKNGKGRQGFSPRTSSGLLILIQ